MSVAEEQALTSYGFIASQINNLLFGRLSDDSSCLLSSSTPDATIQPTREGVTEFLRTLTPQPRARHDYTSRMVDLVLILAKHNTTALTFGWLAKKLGSAAGDTVQIVSETPNLTFSRVPSEQQIEDFLHSAVTEEDGYQTRFTSETDPESEEWLETVELISFSGGDFWGHLPTKRRGVMRAQKEPYPGHKPKCDKMSSK
jgi:hypothetical protein